MIWMDVDTALAEVPVNVCPLTDDTDFKTIETAVAYNAAGMALYWHFVTTAGAYTATQVTPTTGGSYDWAHQQQGMYTIEIPASGGASINNDTEGFGWFTGFATGVLPWRGPTIGFRAAALNNSLINQGTTGLLGPTTAGRTLAVTATGAAGIDWGNVENESASVTLDGTTIATTQETLTLGANAIGAANIAGDAITEIADGVWNKDATGNQTQGSFGQAIGDPGATATSIWSLANTNLDATVSSRMATYTQPTGFLAATFPTTVASTTNITAGTITTATNVTTVNGLAANVITAASIAADAGTEIGTAVWASATRTLTSMDGMTVDANVTELLGTAITEGAAGRLAGSFSTLLDVATPALTVASVNQTGDSFSRIGATGSGLTSLAPASTALSTAVWTGTLATNLGTSNTTIATNLNATVSSRASQASVDDVPTNAEFAAAMALLATNAQLVKALAAVYDSATASGNVLTLSNGATQTINLTTGARTTAGP